MEVERAVGGMIRGFSPVRLMAATRCHSVRITWSGDHRERGVSPSQETGPELASGFKGTSCCCQHTQCSL